MRLRDLTDVEIMDYLDGNLSRGRKAEFDDILRHSPVSRELLDEYQTMFLALEGDCCPDMSPGFADRVMEALPPAPPQRFGLGFKGNLVVVLASLAFINLVVYFVDMSPLLAFGAKLYGLLPSMDKVMANSGSIIAQLERLDSLLPFVCVATLVGLFYNFLDHILLNPFARRS